ncbi:MAG: hypothetical protein K0S37_1955 [Microbacterium sp.]|jgi:hypothetical protein|nr:hypothetical protein [Microbacterium sp.]
MNDGAMETLNAKRMTADQVAASFVVPGSFDRLAGQDHVYVIGPRGSGKTTLLRMLTGEGLAAWEGREADSARRRIQFSSVFVPADELWASQSSNLNVRAAFVSQVLLALVDTMRYRTSSSAYGHPIHLPASLDPASEATLVGHFCALWGLPPASGGFLALQMNLELFLAALPRTDVSEHPLAQPDALRLLGSAVQAFNRATGQDQHLWAVLLDEMELAPVEVHRMVTSFVRGGPSGLILKVSMSPFDRYMEFYGNESRPAPDHDFQTVYLTGQSTRELRLFTNGLWNAALHARGLPPRDLASALSEPHFSRRDRPSADQTGVAFVSALAQRDAGLRDWLRRRGVNLQDLNQLTYFERSATLRKITPLLVYRDALLNFRDGQPMRRSRKKSFEPFTGPAAIVNILEGNPRWIKSAFAYMLDRYDTHTRLVSRGFQFDAVETVSNRFESLLRVLPTRQGTGIAVPPLQLVDTIARYLHDRNLGTFTADAPNSFTVDRNVSDEVERALMLCLYAGAIVHVRDRQSPAVLSSFTNQRFRLTNLLAIRDGRELPLRLGKDVALSSIIRPRLRNSSQKRYSRDSQELPLDWTDYAGD